MRLCGTLPVDVVHVTASDRVLVDNLVTIYSPPLFAVVVCAIVSTATGLDWPCVLLWQRLVKCLRKNLLLLGRVPASFSWASSMKCIASSMESVSLLWPWRE